VVTVVDYYQRFLDRFPDVTTLAQAPLSDVLKLWEGLGYYRRARQLHAAAVQILEQHGGRFPDTLQAVSALPGIGRYTANAILSIADNQALPVLEGNTIRVYSRLLNFQDDVTRHASQKQLWEFAESLVSRHRPGDLNQALMELGSEICSPQTPRCTECPVAPDCQALQSGMPQHLPNKGSRRKNYESLHQAALVIPKAGRVVVRLCGPDEHWTGLWDFPRFSLSYPDARQQLVEQTRQQTGLSIQLQKPFRRLKHAVTRYRITLDCYRAVSVSGRLHRSSRFRWVGKSELKDLPMNATGRSIAKQWVSADCSGQS
jgi:A/G-specific adenine glycosylase